MKKLIIVIVFLLFFAMQQVSATDAEPEPTPRVDAPEHPPLAITPPVYDEYDEEESDRSLLLLILIIVVASGTALSLGFYAYRKFPAVLAKIKEIKTKKAKDKK